MSHVEKLLDILRNLILAMPITKVPADDEIGECVPVYADVEFLFNNDQQLLESQLISYISDVQQRWNAPERIKITEYLNASELVHATMSTQSVVRWNHSLTGKPPKYYDHRFSATRNNRVKLALSLIERPTDVAVSNMLLSESTLIESLKQLRLLDDMLIRGLAASRAAHITGCTLAEVMSLYRTEGNLVVPMSHGNLLDGIPPMESGSDLETSSLSGPSLPNICSRVFLAANKPSDSIDIYKLKALKAWLAQIAGLDSLTQKKYSVSNAKYAFEADFAAWSKDNWTANGFTVTTQTQKKLYNDLWKEMEVETVYRYNGRLQTAPYPNLSSLNVPKVFVRVTPKNQVYLLTIILAEACLYLRRFATQSTKPETSTAIPASTPAAVPTPTISYAAYNLQVGAADGTPGPTFFVSAIVNAARTKPGSGSNGDPFHSLRSEIDNIKKADLQSMTKDIDGNDFSRIAVHYNVIKNWLQDATDGQTRMDELSKFIETADKYRDWNSWDKNKKNSYRGNANWYHLLFHYYHKLTGELKPF